MNGMKNGMVILEQSDNHQKAIFIEEEQLEMMRLRAMFQHRDREQRAMERKKCEQENRRKAWKRYTVNTVSFIGIRVAVIAAVVWVMLANLVHPIVGIPVVLYCLISACINFGVWYGKFSYRKSK